MDIASVLALLPEDATIRRLRWTGVGGRGLWSIVSSVHVDLVPLVTPTMCRGDVCDPRPRTAIDGMCGVYWEEPMRCGGRSLTFGY